VKPFGSPVSAFAFLKLSNEYINGLIRFAVPISIQVLITSLLSFTNMIMIGQLGDTAVAAVGLASQFFYLLNQVLLGVSNGSAIFTAQFWGKDDKKSIYKVMGLGLSSSSVITLIFMLTVFFFSQPILDLFTKDIQVQTQSSEYLRIASLSYIAMAITLNYYALFRSTGYVNLTMFVAIMGLVLEVLLNYTLIFGNFGMPELGLKGAAIGFCAARFFECGLILLITYSGKYLQAVKFGEMFGASPVLVRQFFSISLTVALTEMLWALGITTYQVIYARMSTESIAAVNIANTVVGLAFVYVAGIAGASNILIGNHIGRGEEKTAYLYGKRALILGAYGAVLMGGVILLFSGTIVALYNVSSTVKQYVQIILAMSAFVLVIKVSNSLIKTVILRSGGDTRFSFFLDICCLWMVGVPTVFLGAFVFHLPVYYIFLLTMIEEVIKLAIGLIRFRSGRWIKNLT
jgi:putative MATE family efflux protein